MKKTIQYKGGVAVLKKYGKEHFSVMGTLGAQKRKKIDPEYGKRLATMGTAARLKKIHTSK